MTDFVDQVRRLSQAVLTSLAMRLGIVIGLAARDLELLELEFHLQIGYARVIPRSICTGAQAR